jgi:hypothetical protein
MTSTAGANLRTTSKRVLKVMCGYETRTRKIDTLTYFLIILVTGWILILFLYVIDDEILYQLFCSFVAQRIFSGLPETLIVRTRSNEGHNLREEGSCLEDMSY